MLKINEQEYATIPEAARYIGVSYGAMQRWLYRRKSIVPTKTVGKNIIVRLSDIRDYHKRPARAKQ